jgi:conjugative relaxase-like TrwC/TraI family protein
LHHGARQDVPGRSTGRLAVLSVWKLAHGQEAYYLEAVARGVEDYYLGGEAPGRWVASSHTVGLSGTVSPEALRSVLAGCDPASGIRLGQPHRVPGFDLTFRAPKSVSVLFGLGEPDTARQVRDAHDRAVESALEFAERHFVWSRRGRGGVEQVRAEGIIAAAFRHRTSRNGDPHLHTHVLVPNMVLGDDGKWATLDARWVYTSAKTIGYLYEAQLRHNLTAALGVEWGEVTNGIADIAHIPPDVLKAFSTRRAEIEERMSIRNQYSPKAAMIAALDTRRAKQHEPDGTQLRSQWRERAMGMGFDPTLLRDAIGRIEANEVTDGLRIEIENRMLGADGLTAHDSTFDRNAVLRAWVDALPDGAPIERIEDLVASVIDRHETASLDVLGPGKGAVIRDASGRTISTLPPQERWTTFELLNIERNALATARSLLGAERAVCGEQAVVAALRAAPRLSDEQVAAVIQMTTSGNGVDVLTAPAGAGKTFAFAAARDAWERAGYRVIGAAHTGVAADELAMASGIPTTTIARLLIAIERREPGGVDSKMVLVVDEAGTAGTRDLARLLDEVRGSGAKAVLVGDSKQLPEIAAGGLFAALTDAQPAIELRDNRRQQHEWEVAALRELREGNSTRALHAYLDHGRITVGYDAYNTRTLLVGDWWATTVRGDDAVMLAGRRADVSELNAHGHLRALDAGWLSGPALEVRGVSIQAGDRVMMLRNDRRLGVRNGNRGVVLDVDTDERTLRVQLVNRVVELPATYVDAGHVGHAYAMTVNKAHGLTCDATMMLADDLLYRELAYEAMSRGRKDNRIYISEHTMAELDLHFEDGPHARTAPTQDALEILAQGLERRHDKHLALDSIAAVPLTTWSTTDLLNERDRVQTILKDAPPNRSGDLAALVESRQDISRRVCDHASRVKALETRKRPRKERKLPDVDLLTARHNLHHFEQRAERVDREIDALHANQHRRASHLAAHRVDRVELHAIVQMLDDRLREQTNRAILEPPSYITQTLGPRPKDRDGNRAWVGAVVAIEQYRFEQGITDRRTVMGHEPLDFGQQAHWYRVNQVIDDARDVMNPHRQATVRSRTTERSSPGIEL